MFVIPHSINAEVAKLADLPTGRQAHLVTMFYVYALQSISRNYVYVGLTNNPPRRIMQHKLGKEKTFHGKLFCFGCARERTRTSTSLRTLAPQASLATNYSTRA